MACAIAVKRHRNFDFEPLERNQKRRRLTPSTLSRAVPPTKRHQIEISPFSQVPSLGWDQDELMSRIRYHIRRYNRMKQYQLSLAPPTSSSATTTTSSNNSSTSLKNGTAHTFLPEHQKQPQQQQQVDSNPKKSQNNEGPMFTLKQVSILCERAMKEKEEQLKCEYDQMLSSRLIEQYECFLKFNNDAMFRRPGEEAASYVS